jgi:hypothetical protein
MSPAALRRHHSTVCQEWGGAPVAVAGSSMHARQRCVACRLDTATGREVAFKVIDLEEVEDDIETIHKARKLHAACAGARV